MMKSFGNGWGTQLIPSSGLMSKQWVGTANLSWLEKVKQGSNIP
jgi:hypothetical protein